MKPKYRIVERTNGLFYVQRRHFFFFYHDMLGAYPYTTVEDAQNRVNWENEDKIFPKIKKVIR